MTRSRSWPRCWPSIALLATVLLISQARAQDADDCRGIGALKDRPDLAMARIAGPAPRIPFVKGGSDAKGCPAATDACRAKAYLVPGNAVIAGVVHGGFTCVDYVGAKGEDRPGWIATASLTREPGPPIAVADWVGRWTQTEGRIVIGPAAGGGLSLHGDATYGALDPARVKRGGVNIGEFDATLAPEGASLAFDVGDKATLPVGQGDETDCKVWMRRLGPYLLVEDNAQCGGFNVSFGGLYRRTP